MSLVDAVRIAFRAIASNRMRSGLTALGLIIGVSSVIILIAVGQGAQKGVTDQISGLGTDLIFVRPGAQQGTAQGAAQGGAGSATSLVTGDADAILAAGIEGISAVAPQTRTSAQAIAGSENLAVDIIGTTEAYPEVRDAALASGAFISPFDVSGAEFVVVLGSNVAQALFPDQEPLGQTVRLSFGGGRITFVFEVTGVMAPRGGSEGGGADDQVFVPLTSLSSRLRFLRNATGDVRLNQIDVQAEPGADQELLKQRITDLLLFEHEVIEPDFLVQSQDDLIDAASSVSRTLSILLGSIAGISLFVGGIGVMNIMLVSVTERRREIGIRRAVGARANDIVKQFVAEALTLSVVGGVIGVAIGLGVSFALDGRDVAGQELTTLVQPWSIVIAFAVAAGVGLISGSYPAYRATLVDPIDALRSD